MSSRGSVIPLFLEQMKKGMFTITDKKMTRFNITLNEGVNFVNMVFSKMLGGEIFVPKIPSYKIMDLAKSISQTCKIKIVGKRSGEKIHEEMISQADSSNTVEFKKFYVILPNSKYNKVNTKYYLKKFKNSKKVKENFVYNSNNNKYLTISNLKKILKKNSLI